MPEYKQNMLHLIFHVFEVWHPNCCELQHIQVLILLLFLTLFTSKSFATDYSLSFDGSTNYVDFPFDASMNPTGDFSVNVWVKTGASNDFQSSVTSRTDTINGNEGGGLWFI